MKTPPFLTGAELKAACTEAGAFWEIYLSFFSGFFSLKKSQEVEKNKKTHFFLFPVSKKKKKKKKKTGMFALRERRVHVTQEDFEMAVPKVMRKDGDKSMSLRKLWK